MKEYFLYVPCAPVSTGGGKAWCAALAQAIETAWPHGVLSSPISIDMELIYTRPHKHFVGKGITGKIKTSALLSHPMQLAYHSVLRRFINICNGKIWRCKSLLTSIRIRKSYLDQAILHNTTGTAILITEWESRSARMAGMIKSGLGRELERGYTRALSTSVGGRRRGQVDHS